MEKRKFIMPLPPLIETIELSLAEKVYHTLKQGIISLEIKPREYLFIGDVAKEYGISRTPVREAIVVLEKEGWVENDGRRGARVTVPSVKMILELIEVQGVLEAYSTKRAAEMLSGEQIAELEEILDEADRESQKGNHDLSRALGGKFHILIHTYIGNDYLLNNVIELKNRVNRVGRMLWDKGKAPIEVSSKQHRKILEAIRNRDGDSAYQLMYQHTRWYEEKLTEEAETM